MAKDPPSAKKLKDDRFHPLQGRDSQSRQQRQHRSRPEKQQEQGLVTNERSLTSTATNTASSSNPAAENSFFHSSRNVDISGGEFNAMGHQTRLTINLNQGSFNPEKERALNTEEDYLDGAENLESRRRGGNSRVYDLLSERSHIDISNPQSTATVSESMFPAQAEQQSDLPDQKSSDIYCRHLAVKKRGFPIWIPEPSFHTPIQYQRKGVSIGDVIIILPSGGFDYLFNICVPHDDPINLGRVPPDFMPLSPPFDSSDIRGQFEFRCDSHIASASIKRSLEGDDDVGTTFQVSASEGAILTLPDGARSEDLGNIARAKKYVSINVESWYRLVNGPRGREVENGDVRLVVGCDKVTAWGMAVFFNLSKEEELRLKFKPKGRDAEIQTYCWECSGSAEVRSGPDSREIRALIDRDSGETLHPQAFENQCLFVRTLNATLSESIWRKLARELGMIPADGESDSKLSDSDVNLSSQPAPGYGGSGQQPHGPQNSAFPTQINSQYQTFISSEDVMIYSSDASTTSVEHPSKYLNKMLLKQHPDGRMVITEDNDWISVLTEDDVVFPGPDELVERVLEDRGVSVQDGIISLEGSMPQAMSIGETIDPEGADSDVVSDPDSEVSDTETLTVASVSQSKYRRWKFHRPLASSPLSTEIYGGSIAEDESENKIVRITAEAQPPISRPRHGMPNRQHFQAMHAKYHTAGRELKYSGEIRLLSTYPPDNKEYRPLHDPPSQGSPYHKHGALFARLELLEALICFAHAMWNKDYPSRSCNRDSWETIGPYIAWCRSKWQIDSDIMTRKEKAFLGFIWTLEAFIKGRLMKHSVASTLQLGLQKVHDNIANNIAQAATSASATEVLHFESREIPNIREKMSALSSTIENKIESADTHAQWLLKDASHPPSPPHSSQLGDDLPPNPTEKDLIDQKDRQNTVAARRLRERKLEHSRSVMRLGVQGKKSGSMLSPQHSVNSEKATNSTAGTAGPMADVVADPYTPGRVPPQLMPSKLRHSTTPVPAHVLSAMASVTESIGPSLVQDLRDLTHSYSSAAYCTTKARETLTLPILREHFPKTWARMMYSTLLPNEEHEPDFDDDEGELTWPDQCIHGEGIGWVCLMGKAMVKEFGAPLGYMGIAGVVPRPGVSTIHGSGSELAVARAKNLTRIPERADSTSSHASSSGSTSSDATVVANYYTVDIEK